MVSMNLVILRKSRAKTPHILGSASNNCTELKQQVPAHSHQDGFLRPNHPATLGIVRRCTARLGLDLPNDSFAVHVDACMRHLGVAMPIHMPRIRPVRDDGVPLSDAALYPVAEITSTHARRVASLPPQRSSRG